MACPPDSTLNSASTATRCSTTACMLRVIGLVNPPFSGVPALPPNVRQSIASLSAQQIATLQQGIAAMMNLNTVYATSYRFQANIRGEVYDSITSSREASAWNQCEHGSYFFFSWHRMYLYFSSESFARRRVIPILLCLIGTGATRRSARFHSPSGRLRPVTPSTFR
jgi:tyrosinase-like protein